MIARNATLLGLLTVLGCTPPAGVDQTWPIGLSISAVAAGDLDGDGNTDLVVFATNGIYVVRGGVDLSLQRAPPISTFSKFVPSPRGVTAALIVDAQDPSPVIVTAHSTDGLLETTISALRSSDLSGGSSLQLPVYADLLWMQRVDYASGSRIIVAIGDRIWLVSWPPTAQWSADELQPPPTQTSWQQPAMAVSYASGPDQYLVIATSSAVWRSQIPTTGSTFNWTAIRDGTSWVTQTLLDIDGDGRPELIGYDSAGVGEVCAIDPGGGGAIGCMPTTASGTYQGVQLLAGALTSTTSADLLIVHVNTVPTLELRAGLSFTGSQLAASLSPVPTLYAGEPPFQLTIATVDGVSRVMMMDASGFAFCIAVEPAVSPC